MLNIVLNLATQSWTGIVIPLIIVIYLVIVRQHFGIGGARPARM